MMTGGALLAGQTLPALVGTLALTLAVTLHFRKGDTAFGRTGQSLGSATGLDRIGAVQVFEQPHTSPNYLMREMIFHVARKHVPRLRMIALAASALVPLLGLLVLSPAPVTYAFLALIHLTGAVTQRWLFFAQAEHVVGLFYGQRGCRLALQDEPPGQHAQREHDMSALRQRRAVPSGCKAAWRWARDDGRGSDRRAMARPDHRRGTLGMLERLRG